MSDKKPNRGANNGLMGRPKIELEEISVDGWQLLDSLIIWSAHFEYIAEQLGISEDTLSKRVKERFGCTLTEYRDKKKELIRINIRKKQYDKAVKEGDTAMLIWLGKNECGQTDKKDIKQETTVKAFEIVEYDSED